MIEFKVYSSEKGLYITPSTGGYSNISYLGNYRYNKDDTLKLESTHHNKWGFLEGVSEVVSLEKKATRQRINPRWELIDKDDNEIGLPEVVSKEESCEWYDDDDDVYAWVMGTGCPQYKFRSLYERITDLAPEEWEEVEFKVEHLGEISVKDIESFADMKVCVRKNRNSTTREVSPVMQDLSGIAQYSELEKMLVPEIALHNRPCSISRDVTYNIVRHYIKDNIDPYYARITSDYDFCFTVKKRIRIKPYTKKTEITKRNGGSYAKPRFKSNQVESVEKEIFEMTNSRNYRGYTPIKGFEGESLADLIENVKLYLQELMETINAPLHECEHCKGMGHFYKEVDINEGR